MWKELGKFGMGPPSGGGGQQPGGGGQRPAFRRNNPLLWILIIGAVLIYSQYDGSLFGNFDQSHVSRMTLTPEEITGEFALIDHTGAPRTNQDFLGTHTLIYFGFTGDRGPGRAGHDGQAAFITVDPQRDTVEKLAAYVSALVPGSGRPDRFGGGGRPGARVLRHLPALPRYRAEDPDYTVDHAAFFYLMGPDGKFIQYYEPRQGPTKLAIEIERQLTG
ncbi:Protein SCO2 homolog, mitochondrial [Geodia barretti]|uniref:Protein SCO2 homolog, mitochondrial n=1 Tax=Geodia barretti TaxID=519541 RepID=A0AA35XGB0_GEOBA|nr:Protein SCO2 homolog, mitochondrial [Geodia barretti]